MCCWALRVVSLSIFSPIDDQTCADHDRAEGEGVGITDYTLIKIRLLEPYPATITSAIASLHRPIPPEVFLPAATLRPETMYGQTNVFLLPEGEYALVDINDSTLFVCSAKSALNMSYQGIGRQRGKVQQVGSVKGQELMGCAVKAPLCTYDRVYVLPLTTIKMEKGTGVVTSVPSDAPDDYCFPQEDHELLTADGFMGYAQVSTILASGGVVHVAAPVKRGDAYALEYRAVSQSALIVKTSTSLIEFRKQPTVTTATRSGKTVTTTKSNYLDLVVTDDHRMLVKLGSLVNIARSKWKALQPASAILASDAQAVQFMCSVDGGVSPDASAPLPFTAPLGLASLDAQEAFISLYGYWLGDGWLSVTHRTICLRTFKEADVVFLDGLFARLPLKLLEVGTRGGAGYYRSAPDGEAVDSDDVESEDDEARKKATGVYSINHPSWWRYFSEEYGLKYKHYVPTVYTPGWWLDDAWNASLIEANTPRFVVDTEFVPASSGYASSGGGSCSCTRCGAHVANTADSRSHHKARCDKNSSASAVSRSDAKSAAKANARRRRPSTSPPRPTAKRAKAAPVADDADDADADHGSGEPTPTSCVGAVAPQASSDYVNIKSAKWFWYWVLRRLDRRMLRLLLVGLRFADGDQSRELAAVARLEAKVAAGGKSGEAAHAELKERKEAVAPMVDAVAWTASAICRDEYLHAALRAGFTATFVRKCQKGVVSKHGMWSVMYGDGMSARPILTLTEASVGRNRVMGKEVKALAPASPVPVWCVDVGTAEKLIVIRRRTKVEDGVLIEASRPTVVGNCALMDLKRKPAWREKFGIRDEHVLPFEVVPIIDIPGLGTQAAVDLCIAEKVVSQNDRVKLDLIKDRTYKEGFAKGVMIVGEHAGMKVSEAKPKIKAELIAAGLGLAYSEPESRVMSRSGNECVVAFSDQWYMKYGEEEWAAQVKHHIETRLETYNPIAKKDFLWVVGWLHHWACSRSYGLGTRLPWDTQYVIESLSDSTIYMAYYTIAHLLQGGLDNIDGSKPGPAHIAPEQLTDDVFDFIFLHSQTAAKPPPTSSIPLATLERLRAEFEYWYPLDLRVSGKDLIGNHLTFALYTHAAIWDDEPGKWPQSFFTNGHITIDGQKMSKSDGTFITLKEACLEYSADATRFTLADAGDGLEDANFEKKSANAAILKLTKEIAWVEEVLADLPNMRQGADSLTFLDRVFLNEMNASIAAADGFYTVLQFRFALKAAFHDLTAYRDAYRGNVAVMHADVVKRYLEVSILLIAPICSHYAQHLWVLTGLSEQRSAPFVAHARWPSSEPVDLILSRQSAYLRDINVALRKSYLEQVAKLSKTKAKDINKVAQVVDTSSLSHLLIITAPAYPDWQRAVLRRIADLHAVSKPELPPRKAVVDAVKFDHVGSADKKKLEQATKFAGSVLEEMALRGEAALELEVPFDESALVVAQMALVVREVPVEERNVRVVSPEEALKLGQQAATAAAQKALPGRPAFVFYKAD